MRRREFITLLSSTAATFSAIWPAAVRAQSQVQPSQAAAQASVQGIGEVATLQGSASVTRGNAAPAVLKVSDPIFKSDTLQTGAASALGITFDDETTFSLSANTRIVIDEFVYQPGGKANAAIFNVAVGTAAFVASLVAKTGDMKVTTPQATLGIRGTTGVVEVPVAGAGAAAPTIKLYADADGHIGQIEVFDRQGLRLGALTRGASAFAIRPGAGGRFAAVAYQIPAQEAVRDRGVLQRLNVSHTIGRQMINQRQRSRTPNAPRPNNGRQPREQQNLRRGPGGQQPLNRRGPNEPRERLPRGNFNERRR